ncbi:MAG: pantetheine-phosphate adenylyltransferase [Lachnospiraceae bacterium]|nr:pantetheine-phosphate adenylyltransferase [Lachnospiraceae bacterium]
MVRALYSGSFDPVTLGHLDIIKRAANVFDEVVVAVLNNQAKNPLFSVQERVNMLEETTKDLPNVRITSFQGLLVDFARKENINVIVRGLRAITDFEYELQMAQTNHELLPEVDTMFLTTNILYSYVSSTIVKEVASYQGDVSHFVSEYIEKKIHEKYRSLREQ